MNNLDIQKIGTNRLGEGKHIQLIEDILYINGKLTKYEYIERGEAVMILPILNNEEIIFVKEYRHPIGKMELGLPAGMVDKGFTVEETAIKELKEETGYTTKKVSKLFTLNKDAGVSNARIHCYITFISDKDKGMQELEESEQTLRLVKHKISDVHTMITSGRICNGTAVACLLSYLYSIKGSN